MSYTIAIAGKGGTGKTTIAALVINWLLNKKGCSILAVDADPNSSLAETIGIPAQESIADIIEDIAKHPEKVPTGMGKDNYVEFAIEHTIAESKGVDLLAMGRPEGPGCYCYANNLLRNILKKIMNSYDYVVIDNEAGFEHLSRRTMRQADCIFIVSDPTIVGLRTVERILYLIKELQISAKKIYLIINRARNNIDSLREKINSLGIELAGIIPEDKNILDYAQMGKPIVGIENSIALKEIDKICQNLLKANIRIPENQNENIRNQSIRKII